MFKKSESEWVSLYQLQLPPPFPRSYNRKREFIMRNRDKIRIIETEPEEGSSATGKRYFINEDDIYKLIQEKMNG